MFINIVFLISMLIKPNACDCIDDLNRNIDFSKIVMNNSDTLRTLYLDSFFLYRYKSFPPKRDRELTSLISFIKKYFVNKSYEFKSNCKWVYLREYIEPYDSLYWHEITYKNTIDSAEVFFLFKKRKVSDEWKLDCISEIYWPTWDPLPGPIYVDEE